MEATATPPRRFYLITYPRTASNLLVRILALDKQPNVVAPAKQGGYFFMPSFFVSRELKLREKKPQDWTQDDRQRQLQALQDCFSQFNDYLEQTQAQGKTAFVKEHALFLLEPTVQARLLFGDSSVNEPPWTVVPAGTPESEMAHTSLNPTFLSDKFLQSFLPTFLIRHPALSFPSLYRARRDVQGEEGAMQEGEQFSVMLTLRWTRSIYEFYAQYLQSTRAQTKSSAVWPVVLDADDIITNKDILVQFCELVGMDRDKLQFEWKPASTEEQQSWDPNMKRMLSTLSNSAGIDKSKTTSNIDIDVEAKKWKAEFGDEMGAIIEDCVRRAMPDYEFLRSKRLTPRPAQPEQTADARKESHISKESAVSAASSALSTSAAPQEAPPGPKTQSSFSRLLRKLLPCIPSARNENST